MIGSKKQYFWVSNLWLILIGAFIFYKGIRPGWNDLATDFNNYYASAKLFMEGEAIHSFYDLDSFHEKSVKLGFTSGAKFAPFPPPTAILYTPVAFFDPLTAKRIWLVFNLLLMIALPFRLKHHFNLPIQQNALILSLFFVPIASNLHFGQFYLIASFLLIEVIGYGLEKHKSGLAAFIIGCLTVVKYVPLLFITYLFKARKVTTISLLLVTIFGVIGIFYLIDTSAYPTYWSHLTGHINGSLSGQGKFAIGFQSIDALLNHLFVYDVQENPTPFFPSTHLKPILKWSFVGLIGLANLYLLKKAKFTFTKELVSVFILSSFLLFPASASYHFLLLLLPLYFLLTALIKDRNWKTFLITSGLIICTFFIQVHHIPNLNQVPLLNLLFHFPRLWFLMLVFISLYLYALKRVNFDIPKESYSK